MIIALEGIDGAGKKTQIDLIMKHLKRSKTPFLVLKTPDYSTPVGKAIRKYLDGELRLEPEEAFALYAADVLMMAREFSEAKKKSKVILLDRYITSTVAYQCGRGLPFKKAVDMVGLLGFPKIDKIIYIDISPETSFRRKKKEKKSLDIHEKDREYLAKVRRFYLREVKEGFIGEWAIIDGEKSPEAVSKEIMKEFKF
ncbi:dTMP kinase [Candidatus Micrarchaeota archaeon RBG_16_49_10]|nr:MAG: dTMP kinase [Candidatus Micrarchaeota archaeon RBG_16_49_10]